MDPLRSFTALLESWWRSGAASVARGEGSSRAAQSTARRNPERTAAERSDEALRLRLRARIGDLAERDPARARRAFVETVLTWQFGEELQGDPRFSEMTQNLCDQFDAQTALSERLQTLLRELGASTSR